MPPALIVFRENARQASTTILVRDLCRAISKVRRLGDDQPLTDALLAAGMLECGLCDCDWPRKEVAAHGTDLLAGILLGEESNKAEQVIAVFRPLSNDLPASVVVSEPEGFGYYGLHPFDFADAADIYNDQLVAVVGIRSIGTVLSAVVTASLNQRGSTASRITVRPTGHPYNRETHFTEQQITWVQERNQRGAEFLVVDEGPGLSG